MQTEWDSGDRHLRLCRDLKKSLGTWLNSALEWEGDRSSSKCVTQAKQSDQKAPAGQDLGSDAPTTSRCTFGKADRGGVEEPQITSDCSGKNPEYLQNSFQSLSFKTKFLRKDDQGDFQNWSTCLSSWKSSYLSASRGSEHDCIPHGPTEPFRTEFDLLNHSIKRSTKCVLCSIWN